MFQLTGLASRRAAAVYAPDTFFNEFTARKLSNAFFRGIGSSPTNPGVSSYIDGVPQLNANTSSIELLDVEQIEFVRGPQSALFDTFCVPLAFGLSRSRAVGVPRRERRATDVRGTSRSMLLTVEAAQVAEIAEDMACRSSASFAVGRRPRRPPGKTCVKRRS